MSSTCGAAALRQARALIRAERERLREAGTHRVTRWRTLAPVLRTELEEHGLLREWEPLPDGARQAGPNLGGTGLYSGAGLTGRLCVTLPDELAVPLLRGVYWTNLPHIQAVEEWGGRWGTDATRENPPPGALPQAAVAISRAGCVCS
ncbi:hypothetical protein [Streptomyces sp. NPDC086989]|uniref:hypothetical protein n=1 Tax=Streptomyces sp. NPDC086989 TaxID=3365764 RepID=UPI00380AB0D4